VNLLRSLSCIVGQLPSISESTLQQCLGIVDSIGRGYPSLWPKQRPRAHAAVCRLLAALAPKQVLLQGFLPRLVACLLAHTLRPVDLDNVGPGESSSDILTLPSDTPAICNPESLR
jgi:hypothetical protein